MAREVSTPSSAKTFSARAENWAPGLRAARNIPLVIPKFDSEGPSMPGCPTGCNWEPNPDFVVKAKEAFDPTDKILVKCATGGSGAMAVNALAEAGFTSVYNIVNGFEGDRVDDLGSAYHGKHMKIGWKNFGLPWGYDHHPDLMWTEPLYSA